MNPQDFWHGLIFILGLVGLTYALLAPEFWRMRLFTTGAREKFKPTLFDGVWLAAFALYFLVTSVVFFVHRLR